MIICKALGIEMTNGTRARTHTHTHTQPNQYVDKKMLQCYRIKGYTHAEITMNRPDIIIKTKKEKTCILINVAIPTDRIVMQMEIEKKLNTRVYLTIQQMWSIKYMIILVTTGATRITKKKFKKT